MRENSTADTNGTHGIPAIARKQRFSIGTIQSRGIMEAHDID
jgi:hypothetical protein